MKKFLTGTAALGLSVVFALAGCGGPSNPQGPSDPSGGSKVEISNPWWETTGTLEMDADGKPVFEDVDITLASVVTGEDVATLSTIVDNFNSAYVGKIHIELVTYNDSVYESTVSQQIAQNNNPPDLLMSHQSGHHEFASQHLIQPFDEAMEESGIEISMNDYAAGLARYADLGYTGYTFGVPIDAQTEVVFYNKSLLAKYGNKLPESRSELIDLCERFTRGEGKSAIAWASTLSFFTYYVFGSALMQNGASLYKDDMTVDWYDDAANRAAFVAAGESIRGLVNHDPQLAKFDVGGASATTAFTSDNALFYFGMPWNTESLLTAFSQSHGNISRDAVVENYVGGTSCARWFTDDPDSENAGAIFGDSHFFAMSKSVTDITKKAAILEFAKWFTQTPSVGAKWAEAGHINACTAVLNSEEFTSNQFVNDYLTYFYPDINDFRCLGSTDFWKDTMESLQEYFVSMSRNKTAAEDEASLKAQQDKLNNSIEFFN